MLTVNFVFHPGSCHALILESQISSFDFWLQVMEFPSCIMIDPWFVLTTGNYCDIDNFFPHEQPIRYKEHPMAHWSEPVYLDLIYPFENPPPPPIYFHPKVASGVVCWGCCDCSQLVLSVFCALVMIEGVLLLWLSWFLLIITNFLSTRAGKACICCPLLFVMVLRDGYEKLPQNNDRLTWVSVHFPISRLLFFNWIHF